MEKDNTQYKILIIEDNLGDLLLVQDYLEEYIANPIYTHAKDFKSAKALLDQEKKQFDIVLLDLSLPDKNREELIDEVRHSITETPVIVLTGFSDLAFSMKSISAGISDYLLKENITGMILYKSIIYNIERYKIIKRIKDSERRYNDLFHLSPIPMWVYDVEDFHIKDVNQAAVENYGYTSQEFLSMTINDVIPKSENETDAMSIQNQLDKDGYRSKNPVKHKKKNNELIYVDLSSSNIFIDGKKSRILLANDVTDVLNYTKTIEMQNKKLKEIAWFQSHVVRAPLARLMGLVNLVNDEAVESVDIQKISKEIIDSAKELDGIIRDMVASTEWIKDKELDS